MKPKQFNPDGIDFNEWIHPNAVREYEERRATHTKNEKPFAVLHIRRIINNDHFHAGEFISDLREVAYSELGFPTRMTLQKQIERQLGLGLDPKTLYTRIFNGWDDKGIRGLLAWQANIIEQACWPMPGRNTLPWLQQNHGSLINSFDRLVEILDLFKKLAEDAVKDLGDVSPKSEQPA